MNAYFGQVDRAEATLAAQSGVISGALQTFVPGKTTTQELRRLVDAQATIRNALERVRAITPPPDAVSLHRDLVRLLSLQATLADDVVASARFIPRFALTVRPLAAAAARLGRDLAAVKQPSTASTSGGQLFTSAGCSSCHTLAAAGATGTVGPNLDQLRPSSAVVAAQVRRGGGVMPSFATSLSSAQIQSLANYIASVAGRVTVTPPSSTLPTTTSDVFGRYATAFARYRQAIEPTIVALDRLQAPPELRPSLLAEQSAVHRSADLCATIEQALLKHDIAGANAAIRALFGVAAGVNTAQTRKDQAAALQAYNAQVARIGALSSRVAADRQKLVQSLG